MSNNSDTTKAVIVASAVGGLVGGAVGALAGTMMLKMAEEAGDEATTAAIDAPRRSSAEAPTSATRRELTPDNIFDFWAAYHKKNPNAVYQTKWEGVFIFSIIGADKALTSYTMSLKRPWAKIQKGIPDNTKADATFTMTYELLVSSSREISEISNHYTHGRVKIEGDTITALGAVKSELLFPNVFL